MPESPSEYRPGICNIGRAQVRLRYAVGAIGFAAALLFVAWFPGSGLPAIYLLAAFFPFWVGFEGLIQARMRFCATFAISGVYDLRGSGGERGRVEEPEHRRDDVRRALKIHGYSAAAAAVVTATVYLLLGQI